MPSNAIEKTKLAHSITGRRVFGLALIGISILVIGIIIVFFSAQKTYTLQIDTEKGLHTYKLKRLSTVEEKERGLSGTRTLPEKEGVLFWFDTYGEQCFWMKDMHYAIDIVWLDHQKKITHIEKNVSPKTYPKTFCFPGRYVLELHSGEAQKSGMQPGLTLKF